jgi:predicted AAA+ superfamily ATPase
MLPWLDLLVVQWELYLEFGGFPRMVSCVKQGASIDDVFVNDVFDVVFGDVFKNSKLSNREETQLLERLWTGMTAPANLSSIAQEMDVSKDTVKRHLGYLRDAYLLWTCPQRSSRHWLPQRGTIDKVYAVDPLIARLAHLRNPARRDMDVTALSEMQLGMAVRRAVASRHPLADNDAFLFYHRSQTGKEIDFVSEYLGETALESKYIESGRWAGEAQTLNASQWSGIMATRNVLDTSAKATGTWAVPTAILAYLLDT